MKKTYAFWGLLLGLPIVLFGCEEQKSEQQTSAVHIAAPAQAQQQTQKRLVFTNAHNAPHTIYLSYCLRHHSQTPGANAQQASRWIRRVLVPGEVLYIEEAIDEILWRRESKVSRLPLPNFQRGRVSFDANGRLRTYHNDTVWQIPLRVRGTNELKKFFPALWSQEPMSFADMFSSVSDFITPLVGQAAPTLSGGSAFHCQEIKERITALGLTAQQAAHRILALEDNPTVEEINHAFENKLREVAQVFCARSASFQPDNTVDEEVSKTLCDAKNVLDDLHKQQNGSQATENEHACMNEAVCINKTDQSVYLAPYYTNPDGSAIRVPEVQAVCISPYSEALVAASHVKAPGGRVIEYFVAASPDELREWFSADTCEEYSHSTLTFSSVFSNSYYIIKDEETDKLLIMPLVLYGTLYCRVFPNDPKEQDGTYDCAGNGPVQKFAESLPEAEYLQQRLPWVKAAFESFLHAEGILQADEQIEEDHLPKIGMAFTGGGYRSMIKTAGCCAAAEEMFLDEAGGTYAVHDHTDGEKEEVPGDESRCEASSPETLKKGTHNVSLIDVTTYMSGLSGSTWALSSFFDARRQYGNSFSFHEFGKKLKPRVMFNAATYPPTLRDTAFYLHIIGTKSNHSMPAYDFVGNSYAYHLAKRLLWGDEDHRHYVHLSDLKDAVDGSIPFPLLTAVTLDGEDHNEPMWLEFSPFHVGTSCGGRYWIDSRFFGRMFRNGETAHKGMEEYLGYVMAICGSAYAAHLPGIRDHLPLGGYLPNPESGESMLATRMVKPVEYNFTVGLERPMGRTSADPQGQDVIGYIDGAHDQVTVGDTKRRHNFATIPLLARGLDVIIMCDAVREMSSTHLMAAIERAKFYGLPFPKYREGSIDSPQMIFNNMQENQATLWVDPDDLDAPVIVYLAIMKDDSFDPMYDPSTDPSTHTANFWYTGQKYDRLYGLSRHVFAKAKPVIKKALKIAYERKVAKSRMSPEEKAARADQALLQEFSVLPQPLMIAPEPSSSVPPAEARPLTAEELCDWPDENEILREVAEAHAHEQLSEDDHGSVVAQHVNAFRGEVNAEDAEAQDDQWDDFDLI